MLKFVSVKPNILDEIQTVINLNTSDDYLLPCMVSGHPDPIVSWYKDNEVLETDGNVLISISNVNFIKY